MAHPRWEAWQSMEVSQGTAGAGHKGVGRDTDCSWSSYGTWEEMPRTGQQQRMEREAVLRLVLPIMEEPWSRTIHRAHPPSPRSLRVSSPSPASDAARASSLAGQQELRAAPLCQQGED